MDAKVIVAERISDEGIDTLASALEVDARFAIERGELLDVIGEFEGLIVRSHTLVDSELLGRATRLKVVGRAGTGVDNIDLSCATSMGVMVVNSPESNIISAAEHTIALMLSVARGVTKADGELRKGIWHRAGHRGVELWGKTLGIVGLGRVGSTVAIRAIAFGMRVIAFDPYISRERFEMFGAERMATLDDLVRASDYISVHTPRTEETYGMIGDRELSLAPRGVRVINCARGGIVDEEALARAIRSGQVSGAGIDVFDGEPVTVHELFDFDEVVSTPHLGGSTIEAQVRVGVTIAEQVIDALGGKVPRYALNVPNQDPETLAAIGPFLPLVEMMGSFYTQLFGMPTDGVEVRYCGEVGRHRTELLTSALLKGLLEPAVGSRVNMVNVGFIAESRGLEVTETRTSSASSFASLVTVEGRDDGRRRLSGTLFGERDLRIVGIDGFEVDVIPVGDVLVSWHSVSHVEQPGIVGEVGTMLGNAGVTIGRMEVGRQTMDGRGIMVISPSGRTAREAAIKLASMPGVLEARLVRLTPLSKDSAGRMA